MTVVLDTPAMVALTNPDSPGYQTVAGIFNDHVCYMTPEAVLWLYCSLYDQQGRASAEYWLRFVMDGPDIKIARENTDREFIESAGAATLVARKLTHTGTSAALARRLRVSLVTNVSDVERLVEDGFCEVRFF